MEQTSASQSGVIADALVFGIAYMSLDEEDIERTDEDRATVDELYDMLSRRSATEHETLLAATHRASAEAPTDAFLGKSYRSILKRCEVHGVNASTASPQETLPAALVYAIAYLCLEDKGDNRADDDCKALESISDMLLRCTVAEQNSLIAAARRAFAAELADAYLYQQVLEDLEALFSCDSGD